VLEQDVDGHAAPARVEFRPLITPDVLDEVLRRELLELVPRPARAPFTRPSIVKPQFLDLSAASALRRGREVLREVLRLAFDPAASPAGESARDEALRHRHRRKPKRFSKADGGASRHPLVSADA
jgi:hypothetical protein